MGSQPAIALSEASQPAACAVDEGPYPESPTPAMILLLAVWIGLAAGFVDLGFLVFQKRVLEGDFIRLGHGFPWIIPTAVALLVLVPGAMLALVSRLRRGGIPFKLAVGLLAFVGFMDLIAKLPLELWSSLLLAGGFAVQFTRLVSRRLGFPRFVQLSTPLMVGAVLCFALATSGARAWSERRAITALPAPPSSAPNVLLIVWDTVRAQNLSLYGYGRQTTPHLERLATRGARFEHAFATSSWTLPSHASLFTGYWPHELSVGWTTPLDDARPTLAARLGALGYDTAGFVANLDFCGRETGLARGFAHYEDYPLGAWDIFSRYIGLGRKLDKPSVAMAAAFLSGRRWGGSTPIIPLSKEHAKRAEDIDRGFLDWLNWQRPRGRPFFAFLNYNDAHTPYEPPDDSTQGFGIRPTSWHDRLVLVGWNGLDKLTVPVRDVQMAQDVYDDSIAHLDRRLGVLLDDLDRRGVLDNTLVVVTSDHGEHLGDHALFFHGCSLYRQLVEVPLVIAWPKRVPKGQSVAEPVSLRDLPTTILDLLGLEQDKPFPGRSLARFWNQPPGSNPPAFEPLLMQTDRPPALTNQGREPAAKGPMKSLVAGGMHYILSGDGHEELYALEADPREDVDVAGYPDAQETLRGFRGGLRSMLRKRPPGESTTAGPVATGPRRQ